MLLGVQMYPRDDAQDIRFKMNIYQELFLKNASN